MNSKQYVIWDQPHIKPVNYNPTRECVTYSIFFINHENPWPQATCITQDRSSTNPENSWVSAQSKTSSNPFMDVGPTTHNGSFAQLKFKDQLIENSTFHLIVTKMMFNIYIYIYIYIYII